LSFVAPGFQLASRKAIGGTLLNSSYERTLSQVNKTLQAERVVTLGCDGSSDGCQDPITHVVALTRNCPPFLLREVIHLEEEHSAHNITLELDKDVAELEQV
jgi:hypothetical protein